MKNFKVYPAITIAKSKTIIIHYTLIRGKAN